MNYRKAYISIISKAIGENRNKDGDVYYELHHILPKSLFPLWKTKKSNLVLLTAREHFICHKLLTKIFPSKSMYFALVSFIGNKNIHISSREIERLRVNYSKRIMGENNAFYGRKHSEESKKRMSESAKKRALIETKEQKDRRKCNHSGNRKGVKLTDEQKKIISEKTKEGMKKIDTSKCAWNKGKKCPEHSKKMKGRVAWNKGVCFINYEEIKNIIISSGIDISKFGWAKRLSDCLGIPKNQIVNTVRRFDELNEIAFCDKRRK